MERGKKKKEKKKKIDVNRSNFPLTATEVSPAINSIISSRRQQLPGINLDNCSHNWLASFFPFFLFFSFFLLSLRWTRRCMFHSRLIVEQVETRDYPSLFSRETFSFQSRFYLMAFLLSLSLSRVGSKKMQLDSPVYHPNSISESY